jgi:pimeloyl-ACP methyl ester carboxylesterase
MAYPEIREIWRTKDFVCHGTGSSSHTWSDTVEFLLDEFEVLLVDLPGHGFSKLPAPNESSLAISSCWVIGINRKN